ncbi:histidinol-phosphate aminotransferase [Clostridia bacterium]|nr:histidinol-phosphate aminotransferase [Clostridia bacterium]
MKDFQPYQPFQYENTQIRLDANESPYDYDFGGDIDFSDLTLNRYPDPNATELCKAFGDYYDIDPQLVTVGNGSDELISLIFGTLTDGKVCVLSSDFSMYKIYADIYDKEVALFQKEEDFTVNIQKLIDFCKTENVKCLIFSNPCNPTSLGIKREEILQLLDNFKNSDMLIVVDEAYMDFWNESILDTHYENVIILRTASKAFGLAGIRIGFAVASEKITKTLRAVKSPYNTNTVSQKLAEFVLRDKSYTADIIKKILKNKQDLIVKLSQIPQKISILDSKTNFLFLPNAGRNLYEKLLKFNIITRYTSEGIRITVGTASENELLLSAMKELIVSR